MKSMELETRLYQLRDEAHILALFQQVYGRRMSQDYWYWRFRDNPAGQAAIYLSWDAQVLAAHYAVSATVLRINGQDLAGGLSGTTMTHQDYRGRNLFPSLAQATYERMADLGMSMVYGFPNAFSHRSFIRDLKWVDIHEVPMLRLPLKERPRLPTPGEDVVELTTFDGRFDTLWLRVRDEQAVCLKRDSRHLVWRYVDNPSERYRILAYVDKENVLGYAVVKRHDAELQVVDILTTCDTEVGLALISRVVNLGLEVRASAVSLWLNVHQPLHHALERAGFHNGEPVTYFGALALQPALKKTGLYDYQNWHLTMGDSDVF